MELERKLDMSTSPNSGHTAAVLRTYAKIRQSRTSYVRGTLSEMPKPFHKKSQ
ncbi:MAG: hypothetical protein OD814_001797 [Candidatus Alkanophagales archaeon MCA70_species_1]|nr:hypothetical protein [Candidatus Alkanophaga volatiphilum]